MDTELKVEIEKFCRKHHIAKLMRYFNPLRDHSRKEGEIDLLADFEQGHEPGYISLIGMEQELTQLLGKEYAYLDGPDGSNLLFPSETLNVAIAKAEPFYPA